MKKKINYNEELSPNFSKREKKIKYIIIHYTGTKTLLEALNIFKDNDERMIFFTKALSLRFARFLFTALPTLFEQVRPYLIW